MLIDGGLGEPEAPRSAVPTRGVLFLFAGLGLVAVVLALGVVFSALDATSQPPAVESVTAAAGIGPTAEAAGVVVVQQGDTLTSIARELQPAGDIGPLVDRLAAAHGPGPLMAGDRIRVPGDLAAGGG